MAFYKNSPKITRKQFNEACNKAVNSVRKKIVAVNQLDGYDKYHKAEKEEQYINNYLRPKLKEVQQIRQKALMIEKAGIGRCNEHAILLSQELAKELAKLGVSDASIGKVGTDKNDHAFVEVNILLKDEKMSSRWLVDAWDPRIIDCTPGNNNKIKNKHYLDYLDNDEHQELKKNETNNLFDNIMNNKPISSLYKKEYDYPVNKYTTKDVTIQEKLTCKISPAKPGKPNAPSTPKSNMTSKHKWLYDNYSIADNQDKKYPEFNKSDQRLKEFKKGQKVSSWQKDKSKEKDNNSDNKFDIMSFFGHSNNGNINNNLLSQDENQKKDENKNGSDDILSLFNFE